MSRFVVLEHDSPRGRHWDLMLEHGEVLATWALPQPPDAAAAMPAEPLPDHRIAYLQYEGPIRGGRGSVTCWDRGTYQIESRTERQWVVNLYGDRLRGRATLERVSDDPREWQFALVRSQ